MERQQNTLVTHNDDLSNRDYLLGFRGTSLFGPFEPMNGLGGGVQHKSLGAPYAGQEQNQQYVYSWKLVLTAKAGVFDCVGYANYSTDERGQVVPVKSAAPTLEVRIKGLQSDIVGMKYYVQPSQSHAKLKTVVAGSGDNAKVLKETLHQCDQNPARSTIGMAAHPAWALLAGYGARLWAA